VAGNFNGLSSGFLKTRCFGVDESSHAAKRMPGRGNRFDTFKKSPGATFAAKRDRGPGLYPWDTFVAEWKTVFRKTRL
jgi:hypothetical protein